MAIFQSKDILLAGLKGEKGHGFYRVTGSLTTSSTTVARNLILPNTGKLLVSDSLVDSNGLVFAVTEEASEEATEVKIAYRASIRGATGAAGADGQDGTDGATPVIGENGNWWINGEDTGKPSRGATGAAGADGQDGEQGVKGEQGDSALMASRAIELTNTPIVNTSIIIGADTSGTDTLLFNRIPKNGDNTYLIGLYQSTSYLLGVTCTAHDSAGTTMLINSIVDISSNSSGGGGGTGGSIFYLDISAESSVTALQARNAVNAYNANSVVLCRFAGMLTATLVSVVGSAASMTGNTVLTFLADLGGTIIKLTIDLPDTVSDSEEITVQQEEFGGGGEKKTLVFQNDEGLGQSFPSTGGAMQFSVSKSIYNKWIEIWWSNEDGTRKRTQMYFANANPDQIIERSTEVTHGGTVRYFSYYLRKVTNLQGTYLVFGVKDTSEYSTINMKIYRIYILEE